MKKLSELNLFCDCNECKDEIIEYIIETERLKHPNLDKEIEEVGE